MSTCCHAKLAVQKQIMKDLTEGNQTCCEYKCALHHFAFTFKKNNLAFHLSYLVSIVTANEDTAYLNTVNLYKPI